MAQRSAASPFAVLSDLETRALAASRELPKAHGLEEGATRYIGFRLGQTGLVASMHEVIEILPYPELTGVPGSAPWLRATRSIWSKMQLRRMPQPGKAAGSEQSATLVLSASRPARIFAAAKAALSQPTTRRLPIGPGQYTTAAVREQAPGTSTHWSAPTIGFPNFTPRCS